MSSEQDQTQNKKHSLTSTRQFSNRNFTSRCPFGLLKLTLLGWVM